MRNLNDNKKSLYLDESSIIEESFLDLPEDLSGYSGEKAEDEQQLHFFSPEDKNRKADLESVNFDYGNFRNRQMAFINIASCELRYTDFEMANLIGTSISHTNFKGARFRYTDFEYAEIVRCDFSSSDLSYANFRGADLIECDFCWSDLRGADLSDCTVLTSKFNEAIFDEHTTLPFDVVEARRAGMVFIPAKLTDAS